MESGKHWLWAVGAAAVVSAVVWAQDSGGAGTQNFEPARHVMMCGNVIVSYVMNSGGNSNQQPVIVKMDTKTGQCWVLQLAVNGPNDPTVQSAAWAPIQLNGTFQARGGGNGN